MVVYVILKLSKERRKITATFPSRFDLTSLALSDQERNEIDGFFR